MVRVKITVRNPLVDSLTWHLRESYLKPERRNFLPDSVEFYVIFQNATAVTRFFVKHEGLYDWKIENIIK